MRSKYIVIPVVFVTTSVLLAWQADMPAAKPATQPAASDAVTTPAELMAPAPSTQPKISAPAQAVLDQINNAYRTSANLDLSGSIVVDVDAAGEKQSKNSSFNASYQAPNQFRHESKDQILLVATGQKAFIYSVATNEYLSIDEPALGQNARLVLSDLPVPFTAILQQQNPAMLMALSKNPSGTLVDGVSEVVKEDDVKLDDTAYSSLRLTRDDVNVRVLVDQKSGLVRNIALDMSPMLKKQGTPAVNKAVVTYEYTHSTSVAAAAPAEQFAWVPPKDAKEVKPGAAGGAGDDGGGPAKLVGQPAPAFALKDMDGKTVSLGDLKGGVVLLDFWATWCGPCRAGLPHINSIAKQNAAAGLKTFAVNLEESKDKAGAFMTEMKLTLPVLFDSDGAVSKLYMVEGIPLTVVIGKDGKVAAAIVGYSEGDTRVEQAVEAAMK